MEQGVLTREIGGGGGGKINVYLHFGQLLYLYANDMLIIYSKGLKSRDFLSVFDKYFMLPIQTFFFVLFFITKLNCPNP